MAYGAFHTFVSGINAKKGGLMDSKVFEDGYSVVDMKDLFYRSDGGDGGQVDNPLEGFDENGDKIDDADKGGDRPGAGDGGDPGDGWPAADGADGVDADPGVVSPGINGKALFDKLVRRGIISDMGDLEITIDDKPVDLSKVTDEDQILDILESVVKGQREEMLRDKVDTSSMSDFMRQLIEVDRKGGNITGLLNSYQRMSAPIEDMDLTDRRDQLSVIRHYYKMLGMSEDDIRDNMELIESKDDDFIEARARKFQGVIKDRMSAMVEEEKRKADDRRKEAAERMKAYRKNLRTALGSGFQLSDSMIGKAVDFVTKTVDNEGHVGIDKAYMDMIQDPEKAADLVLFLMNKDEFIRQKTNKARMDVNKNIIKLVSSSRAGRSGSTRIDEGDEKVDFIDLGDSKSLR